MPHKLSLFNIVFLLKKFRWTDRTSTSSIKLPSNWFKGHYPHTQSKAKEESIPRQTQCRQVGWDSVSLTFYRQFMARVRRATRLNTLPSSEQKLLLCLWIHQWTRQCNQLHVFPMVSPKDLCTSTHSPIFSQSLDFPPACESMDKLLLWTFWIH
jgi:hypothetical protein